MNGIATDRQTRRGEQWFASWFDSRHYHTLYADRNDREAADFVDRLVERQKLAPGSTVLDLGCGKGRHSKHLAEKGFDVTGLDLSVASLRHAKRNEGPYLRFVRQDMRRPFGHETFDYVLNLFTSFGYFERVAEQVRVACNIIAALKPGGRLILDYLNVRHAESHLVSEEVKKRAGVIYRIWRWTNPSHIFKRIVIENGREGSPEEYTERVAKLRLVDFQRMFELTGLKLRSVYGDYGLRRFDVRTSVRMILVAEKVSHRGRFCERALPPRQVFADAADGFWRQSEI